MEEDIKALNYRGLAHLVERLKTFFIKNPKNKAAGKYLRCIDSDGNVEWVSLPSFVNLIDGFDPTSLIIGGTSGRTLTTEAEVKGDCYIATAAGTLFPGTVSAITLEAGDSIIFRKDVAAGTSITANDIIFIESSVSISPGTSLLSWDTEITLATVEGMAIKAKLPTNPNTDTQANWNETDTSSAAYILNKPSIPSAQVQADWNQTTNTEPDYIKNKPTIPAAQVQTDWNATIGMGVLLNKPSLNFLPLAGGILTGQVYFNESGTVTSTVTCARKYNWLAVSANTTLSITMPSSLDGPCEVIYAIKNTGSSSITLTLPSTGHNMIGETSFTISAGKLAEVVFTFWSTTDVSFNGGVEE